MEGYPGNHYTKNFLIEVDKEFSARILVIRKGEIKIVKGNKSLSSKKHLFAILKDKKYKLERLEESEIQIMCYCEDVKEIG